MCTLREFDINSRGVANLGDDWKARHDEVRRVWRIEDVIAKTNTVIGMARQLYGYFRMHGEFPKDEPTLREAGSYGYFVHLTLKLLNAANVFEEQAAAFEDERFDVKGVADLRNGIDFLSELVAEDSQATYAAFICGAFCCK